MVCASAGTGTLPGGKNDVAFDIVVPKSGISKWLLSAFCSFSSSKRGVIKYKMYAEELGKSVRRQREAVGNHNGTHKRGTCTSFLGVKKSIGDDVSGLLWVCAERCLRCPSVRWLAGASLSSGWFLVASVGFVLSVWEIFCCLETPGFAEGISAGALDSHSTTAL